MDFRETSTDDVVRVYLCCVVPPDDKNDGCPVCGCHESYREISKAKLEANGLIEGIDY